MVKVVADYVQDEHGHWRSVAAYSGSDPRDPKCGNPACDNRLEWRRVASNFKRNGRVFCCKECRMAVSPFHFQAHPGNNKGKGKPTGSSRKSWPQKRCKRVKKAAERADRRLAGIIIGLSNWAAPSSSSSSIRMDY